MPLERVRRLTHALGPVLDEMMAQMQARIAGHDDVVFDRMASSVLWSKDGRVLWRARAELIGRYSEDLGLFRWWWVGRPTVGESRMDTAYGEAQRLELQELLDKNVVLEGHDDAKHLARLAAHLAGADGVIEQREERTGDDLTLAFYALFDNWHGSVRPRAPSYNSIQHTSVPPHAVSRTMPPPAVTLQRPATAPEVPVARRSVPPSAPPPARNAAPSSPPREVRAPSVELLQTMIPAIGQTLTNAGHARFRQALLVVSVEMSGEKARFFSQIVAQNERGDLEALDTTRALLDAVGHVIGEDARAGNGRWRRLSVRFERDAHGQPSVEHASVVS